ncbi:MAG: branched-chain amino acid ABC transporter permease [Nitrospirae bacterium]|nr:branched-chain amino acid ABC transporter permease [Nitrospirota bacterium]
MFLQQVINGLILGSIYALIALGYTMVYGILELINFAHGEIYMIGAYLSIISFGFFTTMGITQHYLILSLILSFFFSALFCAAYGFTMEKLAYRPLRQAHRLSPLISAIGVSIFLQNYVMLTQGSGDLVFPHRFTVGELYFSGIRITVLQLVILGSAIVLMGSLYFLVQNTLIGKAMRATAQDKVMSNLLGIDTDLIISVTFVLGSLLAAAAGMMVAMYYGTVNFFIGYIAGIKAFTAAVLGGIGSIPGAMLGGLLLGMVESLGAGYISSEYKDLFAFLILILVLLFRPSGLLGSPLKEKV